MGVTLGVTDSKSHNGCHGVKQVDWLEKEPRPVLMCLESAFDQCCIWKWRAAFGHIIESTYRSISPPNPLHASPSRWQALQAVAQLGALMEMLQALLLGLPLQRRVPRSEPLPRSAGKHRYLRIS